MSTIDTEFGPIRSFLWPIHRHELRKLLPMFFMLFLICFSYSVLRNMKDVVVVKASGAEVIPFIKVWVILPVAVLVAFLFTKISNIYSQERVFYVMISGFMACFIIFAFVLHPLGDKLHFHKTADMLEQLLPAGFKGLVSMLRYWTYTGFYVISEMWSSFVLSVIFWGFANEITTVKESRRFYSVLAVSSNLAAIFAGVAGFYFSKGKIFNPNLPFGNDAWEQTIMLLVILIVISGLLTMGIFWWMNKNVLNDPSFDDLHKIKTIKKPKKRLSLRESFSFLSNSRYLACIAVIVIAYNLTINLVEVVWKDRLNQLYPSHEDYFTHISNLTILVGIISTLMAVVLPRIIGRLGWTRTALITPMIIMITCFGFFSFILFQDQLSEVVVAFIGISPLTIAVYFGSLQNCLSKAAKYSIFDTTKEMSFIPLDHEVKLKGKAAIDGVGSRLGKSGGSLIHQGLLMGLSTVSASTPFVGVILFIVILFWIYATRLLGVQFNELVSKKEKKQVQPAKVSGSNHEAVIA